MGKDSKQLDRRSFLKGAAILGGTGLTALGVVGCASAEEPAQEGSSSSTSPETTSIDIVWDEEFDLVIVGGGCSVYGALTAAEAGANVLLVDKAGTVGGTTVLSGNGLWVPNNWLMEEVSTSEDEYTTPDTDADLPAITEYALACDAFGIADPELVKDYVYNVSPVIKNFSDTFGVEFATLQMMNDYYNLPGAKCYRTIAPSKEGSPLGGMTFHTHFYPLIEQYGIDVRTETQATRLHKDSNGSVVGVTIKNGDIETNIGAKNVLLNTGSFDHNEEMVKNYLRAPIYGTNTIESCVGDGHKMGIEVGAALGNMASCWGVPYYQTSENASLSENLCDWLTWRNGDHSIIVNSRGKRFGNETAAYAPANLSYSTYNSGSFTLENTPGFHIGDQSFVEVYNYPGVAVSEGTSVATSGAQAEGLPEWVKTYDTLEELAEDNGIDTAGLLAEVERWNTFSDNKKDEDFQRGEGIWHRFFKHDPENIAFGRIETPPFFCAKIVPGTCGSNGGLKVNVDAQVLDTNGEIIPGLYASGNCSAGYFGTAYPGGGSTVGSGAYRSIRAVNHALSLGIV